MGRVTLTLPRLGETMEEARVTDWLVAPGAAFRRGDVLMEVETDKTVVEVPALADGVMLAHLVAEGDTVALAQPFAEVEAEGRVEELAATDAPVPMSAAVILPAPPPLAPQPTGPRLRASPAARSKARQAGIDLQHVTGTGRRGRIQGADVGADVGPPAAVAVHRSGRGQPVVLLHGLFDDHRGWRDLPRRLVAAGHEVFALDLPGHGASGPVDSFDASVEAVSAVLPDGPLRLIGHSLGAAIAVRLALRLGARVEALVLSAPAGLGARLNPDFTEGMLTAETPAALARALALLDAGPMSAAALAAELGRLQAARAGHAALADAVVQGGFQQIDIAPDLSRLTCPVTVLFGTADQILDWHSVVHLPPTAALHLVRGAGHLPHHAVPDLTAALTTRERRRTDG